MILRLLLIAFALGLVAYVVFHLYKMYRPVRNACKSCDGLGYWRGTRGEKNFCKVCAGTGINE